MGEIGESSPPRTEHRTPFRLSTPSEAGFGFFAIRNAGIFRSMIRSHLAEANRHIAELTVQIVRQRVIVKYALDMGQPSELSESLLHALEESLGAFKKHRELVLDQWIRRPSDKGIVQAPRPATGTGRAGTRHNQARGA